MPGISNQISDRDWILRDQECQDISICTHTRSQEPVGGLTLGCESLCAHFAEVSLDSHEHRSSIICTLAEKR